MSADVEFGSMFPLRVNRKLCSSICPPTIYIHRDDEEDDDEDDVDVGVAPSRCCQVRSRRRERRKEGGEWGVETVRLAGLGQRTRTGMTKWSHGLQGVEATLFCGCQNSFCALRNQGGVDLNIAVTAANYCNTLYFTPPAGTTRIPVVGSKDEQGSPLGRALLQDAR